MSIIKKKKHVSKKNKKDWRKHCDIRDVEDFLEDQRLEERLGKFETKPDSEIFIVDTVGEGDLKPDDADVKPLSAKLKKRQKLAAPPKCFDVLLPSSKVQDPNAKRNIVKPVGSAPSALSKITDKRRLEKGVYQRKVEQARAGRKIALQKKRKAKSVRQNFDKDMWGEATLEAKGIPATLCDDFISTEAQLHNVLPDKLMKPKPAAPKKLTTRAAVELPHPGVSYNPTYQEHQALLQDVVQHEQKMIKREEHLHRVTTGMFSKVTVAEKENQWREEMSTGLPTPHNPANDPDSSDGEYKPINPPVRNKKKDHKARRKQRERLVEKERLKRAKIDKKKITDIYRLRNLQKSISKREKVQGELREKRSEKEALRAASALPALNAHKPPAKEPDFVEAAQLSGDLRNITPTTNLLRDRFVSLQHRGALAASKVMMKKKKRVKAYFKPGHKVTDQDVDRYMKRTPGKK